MPAPRASSGMLRSRFRAPGSTLLPATPTAAPPSSPLVRTPSAALPAVASLSTASSSSSSSFFPSPPPSQHSATEALSAHTASPPTPSSPGQIRAASTEGPTGRDDDLGGPGGQQPPPSAPGGTPDTLKRNWYISFPPPDIDDDGSVSGSGPGSSSGDGESNPLPISGGALLLVGFYAYLTGGDPPSKADPAVDQVKQKAGQAKEQASRKLKQGQEKTQGAGQNLEGEEIPGLGEVSGRKSNMGGVRGE